MKRVRLAGKGLVSVEGDVSLVFYPDKKTSDFLSLYVMLCSHDDRCYDNN